LQKQTLVLFWKFAKRYAMQRNFALLFSFLAVITNGIVAQYVLSRFIDTLQTGDITLANSWTLIATYGALTFFGDVILWRLALYFTWSFEIKGQRDAYLAIFQKLSNESLDFHANRFGGSLVSQSTKFVGAFERFWDMIIWSTVPVLSTVLGSVVTLSILGLWQYAVFLAIYSVTFGVIVYYGSRFLNGRNKHEADKSNYANGYLADMIANISTVKAFGREKYEQSEATKHIGSWHTASTRLKWGVLGATSVFSTVYALGAIAAFLFAVLGAQYGMASAGIVYLVFIYALNINRQLWELNNITRQYSRVIGDSYEMTKILNKSYDLVDHTTKALVPKSGEIVFHTVSFTYEADATNHVFDNFDLTIPAGQRVGIVGHSGSGKTTLTKILLRFSNITHGTIAIDGQDISNITQQSLHEAIAYVAQEPMLFHRSLRENISYGKHDASLDEIIQVAKRAHADDFIMQLKDGYETMVGERGVKLSGGQRQRIAIARAMLKNAPILVLDEATSALDSESEKLIQASLGDLMKNRTSIVIAHRLSTIAKLDRIIVLDNGKIVEDGTHAELLKNNGTYAKLWSHQSGGFIEE